MVHVIRFLLIIFVTCYSAIPVFSALNGGIDYSIPIDYTKLNSSELEDRAVFYYERAINSKQLNEDMTAALNLYTILTKKEPDSLLYALRLGKLYEVIGKDRYAKGQYYHAISLDKNNPQPYFYLGDFFYNREQYNKSLNFYKTAYEKGYSSHYQTLYKMGELYEKFGDTNKSKSFYQAAYTLNQEDETCKKLHQAEQADNFNKEYYRR